jgi:hypothetical protein
MDEFRKHYASLSDEGLREINRDDLTDVARASYDEELAGRGLAIESAAPRVEPTPDAIIPWVPLDTLSDDEMKLVRALLEAQQIPTSTDASPAENYPPVTAGSILFVPEPLLDKAREILAAPISDEELIAEAEAQDPPEGA